MSDRTWAIIHERHSRIAPLAPKTVGASRLVSHEKCAEGLRQGVGLGVPTPRSCLGKPKAHFSGLRNRFSARVGAIRPTRVNNPFKGPLYDRILIRERTSVFQPIV
ncbi:MAG: hypothetical protein C5B57_00480 [Blastocatellia bacterium]|nr:MAG: hypothetical protein C5B57_00480 [Blastocatellia bacterium]